jgi:hypothetical protein
MFFGTGTNVPEELAAACWEIVERRLGERKAGRCYVKGVMPAGSVKIGSNKTIAGLCGGYKSWGKSGVVRLRSSVSPCSSLLSERHRH